MRFGPHETAAGAEVMMPPSDCQLPHDEPFHVRCHSALSWPRTKMSVRDAPHDETATAELLIPPTPVQPAGKAVLITPVPSTPNDHLYAVPLTVMLTV